MLLAIWETLFQNDLSYYRLVLLPFCFNFIGRCFNQWLFVDVIPLQLMLLPSGYSLNTMADVIVTIVVDVITTMFT